MEQGVRAVADLLEGEKEHGRDVPVPGEAAGADGGLARVPASLEQESISGAGNAGGHGAAWSDSDDDEDTEESLTEESEGAVAPVGNAGQGDASGIAQNEDIVVPEENHPAMAHFEVRGFRPARRLIAHAMPPSSYRLPLRGRKRCNPSRFIYDAADAASGCGNAYHPATSEPASATAASASASPGSPSATSRPAGAPATGNAGHGHNNEALGLSLMVTSSGKDSEPECNVSPIHLTRTRLPEMDAAVGKSSPGVRKIGADAKDAAVAMSCRPPSRSRKRRRPEYFPNTEEAVAEAGAKARRSDAAPDGGFFTCSACASPPEERPARVTRTTSGGVQEDTGETGRVLAIAAILGAALALSVVSCVLFYIVGQHTASGLSDSQKKK